MIFQKRAALEWSLARARATLRRRGLRRGSQIVCQASGWVRVETMELTAPDPGEILVRTTHTAVSPGTERALYNRLPNTQVAYPFTPGYSGVGVAIEVPGRQTSIRPGDRVAGQFPHASIAKVRADRCVRVPPGVHDLDAAFVTLGIIALQGIRKAGLGWGDRVAVLGRGLLGILGARLARVAGAGEVTVYGRTMDRPAGDTASGARYDVVLDVTGDPAAVTQAVRLAAPGARVVLLGSSRGVSPPLPVEEAGGKPVEFRGAHARMLGTGPSLPGRWTFLDEGGLYLDYVSEERLETLGPLAESIDPREAWHFYRRLGCGEPPVRAAVFDWCRLPDAARYRVSTFRPPPSLLRAAPERERAASRVPPLGGGRAKDSSAPTRAPERGRTPSRKLGVAFLGCGEVALRNAQAVTESGAAEVRWAIDTDPALARDLARRWGGRAGAERSAALEDRAVDAVFICTPHNLHAPLCLEAIAAGRHVLVEKPMARNAPEAASMIEAAGAAGVVLSTCYPLRFLPETISARSLVAQGGVGRILGARITQHLHREMSYWFGGSSGRSRSNWRARRESSGGGVLLMNLCHDLDVLQFITGLKALRVYCESGSFAVPGDVEDQVVLTLRMTGKAIVSMDASTCAPGGGERAFQIWGTDGQIALDSPPRFLSLRGTSFGPTNDWTGLPRGTERQARVDFVRAFAAAILAGSANPAPPGEALAVQQLIDAAYQSAERGTPVLMPADPAHPADVASTR